MIRSALASGLAALGLLTAGAVHATVAPAGLTATSSVDWTSFSFYLVDTDPTDGVAPAFEWVNRTTDTYVRAGGMSDSDYRSGHVDALATIGSVQAFANAEVLYASATGTSSSGEVWAYAQRGYEFSLSANTIAIFSVNGSGSVTDMTGFASGSAYGGISVNGPNVSGLADGPLQNSSGYYSAALGAPTSQTMFAVFANRTGATMNGSMAIYTSLYFTDPTAPVPEPETWAMLAAGLGLLGLAARRRKG